MPAVGTWTTIVYMSRRATISRKGPRWVYNEHGKHFVDWFKNKVRDRLRTDEAEISDIIRCGRGMDDVMVEDSELFVTSSRTLEKGGDDVDDELDCIGEGEGITIRKRRDRKTEMSLS
ncbi:hypothetical protein ACFE04_013898 [Oxalis oulophora]